MASFEGVTTILLDMDGTLTDLSKRWWDPFFRAFYELKPNADPDLVKQEFERTVGSLIDQAGGNSRFVTLKIFWKVTSIMRLNLIERYKILKILRNDPKAFKELIPLKNAENTVETLHERGYQLGLVTSASTDTIDLALSEYEFFSLFDQIITRDMVSHTKPDPEAILLACEKLGSKPENAVMIGDFPLDVKAGKLAGTHTIAVLGPNGKFTRELIEKEAPDLILEEIGDLLEFFSKKYVEG